MHTLRIPALLSLTLGLACTATSPAPQTEPVAEPVAASEEPPQAAAEPVLADVARKVILAEYDALQPRLGTDLLTFEEVSVAMNFLDTRSGRLPGLLREAALEAGMDPADFEAALADEAFRHFLEDEGTNDSEMGQRFMDVLMHSKTKMPRAHEIDGGCERLQSRVDEHVAACLGVHLFAVAVSDTTKERCPELRYDEKAFAQSCAEQGHAWAKEHLEDLERREKNPPQEGVWGGITPENKKELGIE